VQRQARRLVPLFVDAIGAEQQHVDAHGHRRHLDEELLAPGAQRQDRLVQQAGSVDGPGIALGPHDGLANEAGGLFLQNIERWSFRHGVLPSPPLSFGRAWIACARTNK
jgi:hypothetical protein